MDTNLPSELAKPHPDPQIKSWFAQQSGTNLYLSVMTVGELRKGLELLPFGRRRRELEIWLEADILAPLSMGVLPVTEAIARRWAALSAARQRSGMPLNVADGLIAATAVEHRLALVTRNTKDFVDLPITLINPWKLVEQDKLAN